MGASSDVGTELRESTGDRGEPRPCTGNVAWSCHFADDLGSAQCHCTVIGPYLCTLPMTSTEVMATAAATRQDRGRVGTGTWPHPLLLR